ncbi:hypothetical protein V1293_004907 [Bradyrhizobium sp. AZCC 1693]
MSAGFDRDALLDAFDRIGRSAAQANRTGAADAPKYPR